MVSERRVVDPKEPTRLPPSSRLSEHRRRRTQGIRRLPETRPNRRERRSAFVSALLLLGELPLERPHDPRDRLRLNREFRAVTAQTGEWRDGQNNSCPHVGSHATELASYVIESASGVRRPLCARGLSTAKRNDRVHAYRSQRRHPARSQRDRGEKCSNSREDEWVGRAYAVQQPRHQVRHD